MADEPSFPSIPVLVTSDQDGVVDREPARGRGAGRHRASNADERDVTVITTTTRRAWLGRMLAMCGLIPLGQPEGDVAGRRTFTLTARKFEFEPEVVDVRRNDVVRITVTSTDIAHSFTIDAYRIQKRIPPGGSVTLEFRADEVGRFPFYCSMRADPGCAEMRGELIVR